MVIYFRPFQKVSKRAFSISSIPMSCWKTGYWLAGSFNFVQITLYAEISCDRVRFWTFSLPIADPIFAIWWHRHRSFEQMNALNLVIADLNYYGLIVCINKNTLCWTLHDLFGLHSRDDFWQRTLIGLKNIDNILIRHTWLCWWFWKFMYNGNIAVSSNILDACSLTKTSSFASIFRNMYERFLSGKKKHTWAFIISSFASVYWYNIITERTAFKKIKIWDAW